MNAEQKAIALEALGVTADDFDALLEKVRSGEVPEAPENLTEEELIVNLHVVKTCMIISAQTGVDLDTLLEKVESKSGSIGLGITVVDGTYEVTLTFSEDDDQLKVTVSYDDHENADYQSILDDMGVPEDDALRDVE